MTTNQGYGKFEEAKYRPTNFYDDIVLTVLCRDDHPLNLKWFTNSSDGYVFLVEVAFVTIFFDCLITLKIVLFSRTLHTIHPATNEPPNRKQFGNK